MYLSHSVVFDSWRPLARQTPLSMEFSRQEYWGGLLFPSPEHLPNPGIEPKSATLNIDSLPSQPPGKPFVQRLYLYIFLHKLNTLIKI